MPNSEPCFEIKEFELKRTIANFFGITELSAIHIKLDYHPKFNEMILISRVDLSKKKKIPTLEELELSARGKMCLRMLNINSTEELILHAECDLLLVPNFGRKSLHSLKLALSVHDLVLTNTRKIDPRDFYQKRIA